MQMPPTPFDIEAAAEAAGVSIAALCREVGIDPSTFWRWKAATNAPSVETVRKMVRVIARHASKKITPTRPAELDICPVCPDPSICRRQQRCVRGEPLPAPQVGDAA